MILLLALLVFRGSIWWVSLWREELLRGAEKTTVVRVLPHSLVSAALSPLFRLLFPHFRDVHQLYVHNTFPFSTYMYIHIHIHILCGSPFFPFFKKQNYQNNTPTDERNVLL